MQRNRHFQKWKYNSVLEVSSQDWGKRSKKWKCLITLVCVKYQTILFRVLMCFLTENFIRSLAARNADVFPAVTWPHLFPEIHLRSRSPQVERGQKRRPSRGWWCSPHHLLPRRFFRSLSSVGPWSECGKSSLYGNVFMAFEFCIETLSPFLWFFSVKLRPSRTC